ncbi:MAG: hypothetical protein K5873_06485 [Treponema sp.]|nr:hypothetical protein [Treponema sp.]
MKRLFSLLLLFFIFLTYSHGENLQLVMPKIIYSGDKVEIRYIFHSDAKIFSGDFYDKDTAFLELKTDYDFFKKTEEDFYLEEASLQKINSEYTLILTIFPWKTGYLSIPPFNLTNLVNYSQKDKKYSSFQPCIITLSPVEVKSLLAKSKNKSFMPPASPLVLPGTSIMLVILISAGLVVFASLIFALLRLPKIAAFIEKLTYLYSLKKNSRKSIKKLLLLKKKQGNIPSDKDFAEKIQSILREFLSCRFGRDFSAITTRALGDFFYRLCGGDLSPHEENAVENLSALFSRLEYIRFAREGAFLAPRENDGIGERDSIIEKAITLIEDFDLEEEEEKA